VAEVQGRATKAQFLIDTDQDDLIKRLTGHLRRLPLSEVHDTRQGAINARMSQLQEERKQQSRKLDLIDTHIQQVIEL
jgi:hypothetical protein